MNESLSLVLTFALSAGIGLLVGLERERNPMCQGRRPHVRVDRGRWHAVAAC